MTKKYLKGSAKMNPQYGTISISIPATELRGLVNEKGYVNINVSPRKEPSQYGDTHSIYFLGKDGSAPVQAETKQAPKPQFQAKPAPAKSRQEEDELPF